MPIPHARRRLGGGLLVETRGHVRDWAPPGWYYVVLPSGERILVRSQPVIDPELLWWRSRGPASVERLEFPAQVVQPRATEVNAHVQRYLVALANGRFSTGRFFGDLTGAMIR